MPPSPFGAPPCSGHRLVSFALRVFVCAGVAAAARLHADPVPVGDLKKLSIEELMEITVTSVSRTPTSYAQVPSALQVITQSQIHRSGALTLPEALRLANNLNVAQRDANGWAISARGFNTDLANKMLVMLDGRTLYTPLFSGVRWDGQDYILEDIDRIEVISGPGGTVWGANAVNGVINITSKNARDTQGWLAEAATGDRLDLYSSLRYGGRLGARTHYRVYAKHTRLDESTFASGAGVGDASSFTQGGFRIDTATGNDGTFTFQGDYSLSYENNATLPTARAAGGNLLGRWTQDFADGSNLSIQFYYDRTFLRFPQAANSWGPAGVFRESLHTYDFDLAHTIRPNPNHQLVWGLGFRYTRTDTTSAPTLGFAPEDLDQRLFSAFLQDQIRLSDRNAVTVGTKFEHNDYTGSEVSPTVRIQRDLTDNRLLWASVSRAVRMPSRIDHDLRQPSQGTTILSGGSQFKSETVVAYEVGYRAQVGANSLGSISLFYNDYDWLRSLNFTPDTILPLYFGNDLTAHSYGVELTTRWDPRPWWRLQASYTLLKNDVDIRDHGYDLNNALNETSDPEHQVSLTSSWDLRRNLDLDAQFRWVDRLIVNNSGRPATVPAYVEINARLAYRISDELELSLMGQNLLDSRHTEFGVPGPNQIQIPRSFFAKATWRY